MLCRRRQGTPQEIWHPGLACENAQAMDASGRQATGPQARPRSQPNSPAAWLQFGDQPATARPPVPGRPGRGDDQATRPLEIQFIPNGDESFSPALLRRESELRWVTIHKRTNAESVGSIEPNECGVPGLDGREANSTGNISRFPRLTPATPAIGF